MSKSSAEDWSVIAAFVGLAAVVLVFVFWNNISSALSGNGWNPYVASSCKDVTSYDRNWGNDMLCTRADGSTFYASYEGARKAVEASSSKDNAGEYEQVSDVDDISLTEDEVQDTSTTCEDVTTYDYDWDNDMYCTRSDGTSFYTDYAGASAAEGQ